MLENVRSRLGTHKKAGGRSEEDARRLAPWAPECPAEPIVRW